MRKRTFIPIFFLCFGIAVGSDFLTLREAVQVPKDTVYLFGHNAYADYFYYLSMIGEGTRGKFLISSRYTTEQFRPQFAQPFFTFIGYVGGWFGQSPQYIYWASRITGGTVLLFLIYCAGYLLLRSHRYALFSFCTVLVSAPMWKVETGILTYWANFWTGFDPVYRIAYLPHHLFANIFGLLALVLFSSALSHRRVLFYIGALLSVVLAIGINPAIACIYIGAFTISFCISVITKRIPKNGKLFGLCIIIISILTFAVSYQIYSTVFPWTTVVSGEKYLSYPIDFPAFLLVLGPFAIFACIGAILIKPGNFFTRALTVWFFLPVVLFFCHPYISGVVPVVIIRFVQSAPYIPTGLLAAYAIYRLSVRFAHTKKIYRYTGRALLLIPFILVIPTFISSFQSLDRLFWFDQAHAPGFYISKHSYDVMLWLHDYAAPDSVVLSVEPLPYMIPAFTHTIVPYGNPWNTYQWEVKRTDGFEVFNYTVLPAVGRYLSRERVSYLVTFRTNPPKPEFLRAYHFSSVYSNAEYDIYYKNSDEHLNF